ncbi:hypothetical protein L3Q82_018092, partial [Scortum barcoo]
DVVLMASSGQDLQHVLERFAAECEAAGMRISTSKSEAMVLDRKRVACPLRSVRSYAVGVPGEEGAESKARSSRFTHRSIYVPTLTYGHELWVMTDRRTRSRWIQAAEMSFLRRVAGRSLRDRVRSSVTRDGARSSRAAAPSHREESAEVAWASVLRMPPGRLPREVFQACPTGRRPQGRPRTRWRDYVSQLAWERLGIPPEELEEVSGVREGVWASLLRLLPPRPAICQGPPLKSGLPEEKKMICAVLARVMLGKQLDVRFDEDESAMPLMSAAKLWPNLKDTVEDETLFKNINILLVVQSVAVCLEKGQRSSASYALKWLENNLEFPQSLRVKLTTIVTQKETYHPFLMSFSYSRLLETVQSYLDAYLKKNPSDYLLKAAAKMVQLSENTEALEDKQDGALSETANKSPQDKKLKEKSVSSRTKRKLLSTRITDVWTPDSCKKAFVSVRRIPKSELSKITSETSKNTSTIQKTRKRPEKWTSQLDKCLKDGVKRHGQGKWSRILMDYDFEGRTGTMLKDRWRVLMRSHQVG